MPKPVLIAAILLGLLAPGCAPTEPKATVTVAEPQAGKVSDPPTSRAAAK